MHYIFNAFERHWRRTRYEVLEPMMRTGAFEFNSNWSKAGGFDARVLTPDSELTTRFIVLMYRFLNPADNLYYRTVWQLLNDEFASEISPHIGKKFTQFDTALVSGGGAKFRYNTEDVSAEQVYRTVAEGAVFGRAEEAQAFLAMIAKIPGAIELYWFQFYNYSMAAFEVVSLLFTLIQRVEETDAFKARFGGPGPSTHRCIFCLGTTGTFLSEEHIIPESLGNTDWILPRGYVCDGCNNGKLAKLDNALADSPLFAYQRLHFVPYDKAGRLPEVRTGTITWKRTGPLNIHVTADPGTSPIKFEEVEDGLMRFSYSEKVGKFDERLLARALCKVALEIIAADKGVEYACHERFNAARSFIRQGTAFRNNLFMRTKFTPQPRIEIRYIPMAQGTTVGLDLYGLQFLLNLEELPFLQLTEELALQDFISFPLYGKSSWRPFTVSMVPSVEMLGNLPKKYWPDTVVESHVPTSGFPQENRIASDAVENSKQAQPHIAETTEDV